MFYWLALAPVAGALFVTLTRSAWLGGAMLFLFLGVVAVRTRVHLHLDGAIAVGVAIGGIAGLVMRSAGMSSELNVFSRVADAVSLHGSAGTRVEIWKAAIRAFRDHPVLGNGPDTFRTLFPHYKSAEYVRLAGYNNVADNAHNYVLQTLATTGLPGLVLLYGFFVAAFAATFRLAWSAPEIKGGLILTAWWAAAVGYSVHLLFGLSTVGSSVALFIAVGVLCAANGVRTVAVSGPLRWLAVVPLVLLLATVVSMGLFYVADQKAALAQDYGLTPRQRVALYQQSLRLNPFNYENRLALGDAYRGEFREIVMSSMGSGGIEAGSSTDIAARGALSNAEDSIEEVIRRVPQEFDSYAYLANLYNFAGSWYGKEYYDRADSLAQDAIDLFPNSPQIRVEQAIALWNVGKEAEAFTQIEVARKLDGGYATTLMVAGDFYAAKGRWTDARVAYQEALAIEPDNAVARQALAQVESRLGQ